jgi:hypothetical protein
MAASKSSLFASAPAPMEDDGEEDYSDDAAPAGDDEDAEGEAMAGPFDAYAETVLDAKAPTEDRISALREAILTLIEEKGSSGGMPSLGGMNGKLGLGGG